LKRTPKDKALMNGNLEAVAMMEVYLKENSRYLI
jgi:hypothetical protein